MGSNIISDPVAILRENILSRVGSYISQKKYFLSDYFGIDKEERSFRKYLKSNRNDKISTSNNNAGIVLIESLQIASNNIALSVFLNSISDFRNSQVIAYRMIEIRRFTKLKALIRHQFSILRALGAKKLVICGYHPKTSLSNKYKNLHSEITNLEQLEDFQLHGIHLGDLIYDLYLTRMRQHTVDLRSVHFRNIFNECVSYFLFWEEYFKNKNVKSIFISHCVYNFAIPARVAIDFDIDVFQVQSESVHRLDKFNSHAYLNSIDLKKEIELAPSENLEKGLILAKSRISKRFNGEYVEELELSSGVAFRKSEEINMRPTLPTEKLKVLVATHDFFDAVHFFGKAFYTDFYDWIRALSRISNEVDYEWYIKVHPDAKGGMPDIIQDIALSSRNWRVLPQSVSHYDVFQLGIDIALTVHGTIATEYPYFNIPVVNATTKNPHVAFDFSITPESKADYERLLINLPNEIASLKNKSIFEYQSSINQYYFGRHILTLKSWIYEDYGVYLKDLGGWDKSMSKKVYGYFLSGTNQIPETDRSRALRNFIDSRDARLERRHFSSNSVTNTYLS
jgi:hypothetical protein